MSFATVTHPPPVQRRGNHGRRRHVDRPRYEVQTLALGVNRQRHQFKGKHRQVLKGVIVFKGVIKRKQGAVKPHVSFDLRLATHLLISQLFLRTKVRHRLHLPHIHYSAPRLSTRYIISYHSTRTEAMLCHRYTVQW